MLLFENVPHYNVYNNFGIVYLSYMVKEIIHVLEENKWKWDTN